MLIARAAESAVMRGVARWGTGVEAAAASVTGGANQMMGGVVRQGTESPQVGISRLAASGLSTLR